MIPSLGCCISPTLFAFSLVRLLRFQGAVSRRGSEDGHVWPAEKPSHLFGQPQISKERLGANCAKGQGFTYLVYHSILGNILRYILKFQFSKTKTKNGWGSDIFIILLKVTQFVRVEPGLKPERGSLHSPHRYWVGVSLFSFASITTQIPSKNPVGERPWFLSLSLLWTVFASPPPQSA